MRKLLRNIASAVVLTCLVVSTGLLTGGVASAATTSASFQLKSGTDSVCRGTVTLTVTSTTATSTSKMDCYDSPFRMSSLSAQAHLHPAGQPNFNPADSGCLDCSFAQAINRTAVQPGVTYCSFGGALGFSQVDRPWSGRSPEVCLRAP